MQRRSNGHDSTSPLPVVIADVSPEEIQVVEPGWWPRLRAWTDRAKLLHLLGCALGAVVVALVVAGWRARGTADSLARKADVATALTAHADQAAHGTAELRADLAALKADVAAVRRASEETRDDVRDLNANVMRALAGAGRTAP